jgi:hypothetical protein
MPKTSEIAKLAATLAHGRQIDSNGLEFIAAQAIALLEKCEEVRTKRIYRLAAQRLRQKKEEEKKNEIPLPKKYPATFDEFLRLTIGGRYKSQRLKIYRDYINPNAYPFIWAACKTVFSRWSFSGLQLCVDRPKQSGDCGDGQTPPDIAANAVR